MASHTVALGDTLADGLDHLSFPEHVWEAEWAARSGRYTNRYRFSEWLAFFACAGFKIEVTEVACWDALPTPRDRLDPAFQEFTETDLLVRSFSVILRPSIPTRRSVAVIVSQSPNSRIGPLGPSRYKPALLLWGFSAAQ